MSPAYFSNDKQFYQYENEKEFNDIIQRLYHVMRCNNDEGISEYLRIDLQDVVDAKNKKLIPTEWFKRFFFVLYSAIEEIKCCKILYNNREYFNIKYKEFI